MKYLFFDIECANNFDGTGKICEFGFVLADEELRTIDHGIFLVDPDSDFEQYVLWNIVKYKVEDYHSAPKYPEVYNSHIKSLLEMPDTVLVGHGVRNDLKFLYDEARRYSIPLPKLGAIDTSIIWQRHHKDNKPSNLKKLVKELGIGNPKTIHNSEFDAQMTLEYTRYLCESCKMSFNEIIKKYFSAADTKALLDYASTITEKKQKLTKLTRSDIKNINCQNKRSNSVLRVLAKRVEPIGPKSNALSGKKISVSNNYTTNRFDALLNLIGIIKAAGGEYELLAERSDIFCTYEKLDENGTPVVDKKMDFVKSAVKNGKDIKVIAFDDLLNLLGTSREELEAMPELDTEYLLDDKYKKKATV